MAVSPAEINGGSGNAVVHEEVGACRMPEAERVCEFVAQEGHLTRRLRAGDAGGDDGESAGVMTHAGGCHRATEPGFACAWPDGTRRREGGQEADMDLLRWHSMQGGSLRVGFTGAETQAGEVGEFGDYGGHSGGLPGQVRSRNPDGNGQVGPPAQRSAAVMPQKGVVDAVLQRRERGLPAAWIPGRGRQRRTHQVRGRYRVDAQKAPPPRAAWTGQALARAGSDPH